MFKESKTFILLLLLLIFHYFGYVQPFIVYENNVMSWVRLIFLLIQPLNDVAF